MIDISQLTEVMKDGMDNQMSKESVDQASKAIQDGTISKDTDKSQMNMDTQEKLNKSLLPEDLNIHENTEFQREDGDIAQKLLPPEESSFNRIEKPVENEGVEKISTIREDLVGSRHPETGVPYESKIVEDNNGVKVEGVFPDFSEHSVFETQLPDDHLLETDGKQKDFCNSELKDAYESGTLNTDNFSDRQKEQIIDGHKPEGYIWHHNEEKGKMELVPEDIHSETRHTGGKNIWGGGTLAR